MTQTQSQEQLIPQLHPRPQMARAQWTDLCGSWGFAYDDEGKGLAEHWQDRSDVYTRTIEVPFPPESTASGIHDPSYHPVLWYRRTFQQAQLTSDKRLLLHCGAVDYRAQVWINGQLVATHEGGMTPFSVDITESLRPDGTQGIVIRAEDLPKDLEQPRGKQDWEEQPHTIWYYRTSGIWQPIWLEVVGTTYINEVRYTPDIQRWVLGLAITLNNETAQPLQLRVQLRFSGNVLADEAYALQGKELRQEIGCTSHRAMQDMLWSPEHPHLLDVTLSLLNGEELLDEIHSYVGLRSVGVEKGFFLLNGSPYYLRLVLEQGYWPESHLVAPNEEAGRREVELIKELGFNGIRIHQKVEDPRFLYWCDRLGLLVWGEMANAYVFSQTAMRRLTREWLEVLARDYNHPCIVTWVPLNESWGVPNLKDDVAQQHFARSLYHLTKALDPTRPVIGNDGWEHTLSDIHGIHDYAFEGSLLRERYGNIQAVEHTLREVQPGKHVILLAGFPRAQEPIVITEFGGISFKPEADTPWFGYGTVTSAEDYLAKYRELIDALLDSTAVVGFCYTQLTDTEQETNGLLTAARKPKLDIGEIREITSRASAAMAED